MRRFLGRRRTLVALIAASAVAASLLLRSDSIALAQDSGSTPTLDLTGVTVVVSGSLDLSSQSVLQQYVSEGTSNDTSITGGQLIIVNPVLGDSNFVIGGTGNDPRRVGQTYGVPSSGSGSETVWAFLENEARQILAAQHQIPNGGDIPYWGRGLMRAWMLIRLMEIIRKPTSERTTDEQAAVTFLRNKVWERQKQVIGRSVDQYYAWERDPCSFDPPAPYQYDTPAAYCNPNSYQSFILGTPPPPSAADFLDYGAASASEKALERIVRQLSEAQGIALQDAHPVVDVEFRRATNELRAGLDLFRVLGRGLVDGNTDFTGSGESPLSDDTLSTIKELYDEILVSEAADTLFEFAILAAFDRPELGELIVAEVLVLIKAIWDRVDLELLDDRLLGAKAEIEATPPDLNAMLDQDGGLATILGIFMEETMHDHLFERKQSLLQPPAQSGDLQWERTKRADSSWASSELLSELPISDWRRLLGTTEIDASTRGHWLLLTDPSEALIYSPGYGKIQVNAPEKSLGLGYTNWNGEYWTAWWVGSTFIHVKEATPLTGVASVRKSIEGRCPPQLFTMDDQVTGPDCVEGSGTSFSTQLHQGDTVLLGGEYRTVLRVVNDQFVQVTKPFSDVIGFRPVVRVAGSRGTCWKTGECFESDEIHYRWSGQDLKARFSGNRAPALNPEVTGTLQTKVKIVQLPGTQGAIGMPVVTTGFAANTVVTFEANAVDPDGDSITIHWTFEPSASTPCGPSPPSDCTVDGPTATFRWTSPGTYVVTAVATDSNGATTTWTRDVVVLPGTSGTRPVAGDDAVTTPEDTPIEIFVGGNDLDVDNDIDLASVSAVTGEHGTWRNLTDGWVRFTPAANFNGRADGSYRICDDTDLCDDASIAVNVLPTNDPPVANDDAASTSRETPVTITPWSNDTDLEGPIVQASLARACTTEPSGCAAEDAALHGTWTIASRRVTFTPAAGFVGTASYRYRICDTDGACDSAVIRVRVIDNYRPMTVIDRAQTLEDSGPIRIDVLANDRDPDGRLVPSSLAPVRCGAITDPGWVGCIVVDLPALHGTWSVNSDNTLSYRPETDFNGTAFHPAAANYQVCDDDGACSQGRVEVEVGYVNDVPAFVKGPDQTVDEDSGPRLVTGWATSIRPGPVLPRFSSGDNESWQVVDFLLDVARPELFAAQPMIDEGGTLRFTPAPNATGSTQITVRLHDEGGTADGGVNTSAPQTFTITINGVNDPPTAVDDLATVDEDTSALIDVLANDADADRDTLTISSVSQPSIGSASVVSGRIRYAPDRNRSGSDRFTYTACDPSAACSTAGVTITVNEVGDAPTINGNRSAQTVQYSDAIDEVTFSASDPDTVAGRLVLTASSLPAGLAFLDHGDGTGTLSGTAGVKEGAYEITVRAADPGGLTGSSRSTVVVVPEDASIAFRASDPTTVKVAGPGATSGRVALTVLVSESEPDSPREAGRAGNINRAVTTAQLVPVGPGSPIAGSCTAVPVSPVRGYRDELTVTCSFSSIPVNTYAVRARVEGGWYAGIGESVLTVFDPSLGFTTGGGWFFWPGTTDRTNFGYTVKYNPAGTALKGNLLVIRHRANGSLFRLKSDTLDTLAVGQDRTIPMGWAIFTGTGTYIEPGWARAVGDHIFTVYAEDRDKPGTGVDRLWIKIQKGTTPVTLSMAGRGPTNAVALNGGNLVAPHQARSGR